MTNKCLVGIMITIEYSIIASKNYFENKNNSLSDENHKNFDDANVRTDLFSFTASVCLFFHLFLIKAKCSKKWLIFF